MNDTLTCTHAPIDGTLPKELNGRAGKPCEGPVELRASVYRTDKTVAYCTGHFTAAQAHWKHLTQVTA